MKIRIKSVPQQLDRNTRNSRKWHGDGGYLQGPLVDMANMYAGGGVTFGQPYYDYNVAGHPLTINANVADGEVVVIPDSRKSPADRAVDERTRRANYDMVNGRGTYNAVQDRELTDVQVRQAQKEWEKSAEKKALDKGIALAQGVGIGADIVSTTLGGLPVYSGLKGTQALDRATQTGDAMDYVDAGLWLSPLAGATGRYFYNAAKPVVKNAANEAAIAWSLRNPEVPEGLFQYPTKTITKVGDAEVNNPNLLYHLDRGNSAGAFSSQGAYTEDGVLYPGAAKKEGQLGYSWWNEGKPYATSVNGQPMTRMMTATKDTPGMLQVRSQNYPIGQWTGSKGFVLPSEYVNPEGVNVSRSTYHWEDGYGWRKDFTSGTPAAEWATSNASYLNGKPEIGMYFPDGKTFNTTAFAKDLGTGIADARSFLGSEIKTASDAHNTELAKRLGFPRFMPYTKAQERASIYVRPQLTADKSTLAGSVRKNTNDPALDEMTINVLYDADKGGFHETLHRGNYGEEGFSFDPEAMNFMDYHQIQEDTRGLYQFKTDKLLAPKTNENAEWHNYMSRSAEAATNAMEIGRRMGLKPGAPWPGREKALELYEKYAASKDQKTKAFNVLNWKQKPRRIWDALTGRYFILGAGALPTASLTDN